MLTLGIDTSGKTASCALCTENAILAQNSFLTSKTHSQVILPMVKKMLSDSGKSLHDLDGIAVISGPGSYTGLRIGIAAVKGICFADNTPCAGVSALESLAYNFMGNAYDGSVICAVMHARQELVYTATFTIMDGKPVRETEDRIMPASQAALEISGRSAAVYVAGDYAEKFVKDFPYPDKSIYLASPLQRMPLASSLCYAAMAHGFGTAEQLNAEYMQITKAEKDLQEK